MANFPGTAGPDYHTGTAEADRIDGGGGPDILSGAGGDDVIDGGADFDQIDGDEGTDIVHGGEGNDSLKIRGSSAATPENDQLFGDGGDDYMEVYLTGARSDTILLDGGDGNDRINFHAWHYGQSVTIAGGTGNDSVFVIGGGAINVDLGAGDDNISFNYAERASTYSITLGAGSDLLVARRMSWNPGEVVNPIRITDFAAGAGGDRISIDRYLTPGGPADWPVNPFASGHLELVQRGPDSVLRMDEDGGGDGFVDFIVFEGVAAESLTAFNLGYAPDGGATPAISQDGDALWNFLVGGGGGDVLRGFGGYDELYGGGGDDRLEGGDDGDSLDGGLGDDVVLGEAGDDHLYDRYGGDDQLYGGDGYDQIEVRRGGLAASTLLIDGGAGHDHLSYMLNLRHPFVDTVTLIGGLDGDSISSGGAKISTIDAGAGNDSVYLYNIVYQGQTTLHTVTLGSGQDELQLYAGWHENGVATVTDFATGNLGDRLDLDSYLREALSGWDPRTNPYETGHLRLVQRGADSVLQMDRDGAVDSRGFTDLLIFSNTSAAAFTTINLGGYSSLTGTDQGERLEGDSGRNALRGLAGDDVLVGNDGDDSLYGGSDSDRLEGGEGADRLDGGAGADLMIGGGGEDLYIVDDPGDQLVEAPRTSWEETHPDLYHDEVRTSLAVYTKPDNVERLTGTSDSGQTLTGGAGYDVIAGGGGNDLISMFEGGGSAFGGAGDDRIEGGGGIDNFSGGAGSDSLFGYGGDDSLDAGYPSPGTDGYSAADRLEGGEGNDWLRGNRGSDVLLGGAGNDRLEDVQGGADLLDGGDGDDWMSLSNYYNTPPAVRTVIAGAGNDLAQMTTLAGETLEIDLGEGDDRLYFYTTFSGAANVVLGAGRDSIEFSDYMPSFDPGSRVTIADFAAGPAGDVLLLKAFLAAWLTDWDKSANPFLTGHVRLVQDGSSTLLQLDRNGGGDDFATRIVFAGTNAADLRPENLDLLTPNAVFGTAAGDTIRGSGGDDRLDSGDGNDNLRLQDGGNDTAIGGGGNDWFLVGAALTGADVVDGGEGKDEVTLQGDYSGGLTLGAVTGVEVMVLLPGNDVRFGAPGTQLYSYSIVTTDLNVASGVQLSVDANRLRAGENLVFDGSAETDGSFYIFAGKGIDTLTGGAKNDAFLFRGPGNFTGADTVNGGAGFDELALRGDYTGANKVVFGATTISGIEAIVVVSGYDLRYGKLAGDYSFDLTMDEANVQSGQVMIVDAGTLRSGERLVFDGSAETDGGRFTMFGGQGNDTLTGGSGADSIRGSLGADVLKGNGGADTFVYRTTADSANGAADHILDFVSGTDRIDLSRIDANSLAGGDQAFHWIGSNAFSGSGASSAGELRAYQDGASWFVEGDTNGDGTADLLIQVTGGALTQGDFLP